MALPRVNTATMDGAALSAAINTALVVAEVIIARSSSFLIAISFDKNAFSQLYDLIALIPCKISFVVLTLLSV